MNLENIQGLSPEGLCSVQRHWKCSNYRYMNPKAHLYCNAKGWKQNSRMRNTVISSEDILSNLLVKVLE
jgi:hypothetical protein